MILYILLTTFGLTKGQLTGIHFTMNTVILIGCLDSSWRYGVALREESKNGMPHGCGFEYPIHSIIFIISLIDLIY
ncbi:unnamed protein product, partial [Rotaria sp. Silwood1]